MKNSMALLLSVGIACFACKKPAELTKETLDGELSAGASIQSVLPYDWGSVAIGGGGYVTGIVIHPTQSNRMYIRTDVGGAYKWDGTNQKWVQMLDGLST